MPRFEPFRALRFAADDLTPLVAPPYDVLADADVDELEARSPYNITHVDVPRGGPDRYERAAATLQEWVRAGVMVSDAVPSFTLYRLRFTDAAGRARETTGVLGALEVVDPGSGGVLPHERTTPKDATDRLELTRATRANLSPVWGLSLASGLTGLLAEPDETVGRVVADGVEHVVERVTNPERIAAIRTALGRADVLVADGHHRYGVARTYRDEVRTSQGPGTAAELTLAFVQELVADQLSVEAIHRVYAEQPSALEVYFTFTPTERPAPETLAQMQEEGFLVLHSRTGTFRLDPRPGAFAGQRALDGLWLETTLGSAEVRYQHGLDEALAAVDSGAAEAVVLIRPVSVAEIERTALEGVLMPPKSTFFTPKLKTGFVVRPLSQG